MVMQFFYCDVAKHSVLHYISGHAYGLWGHIKQTLGLGLIMTMMMFCFKCMFYTVAQKYLTKCKSQDRNAKVIT